MLNNIEFNEDERDCLQELMNIAYGGATAAISEILDAFATLNVPKIKILPALELKNYFLSSSFEFKPLLSISDFSYLISLLFSSLSDLFKSNFFFSSVWSL